MKRFFCAALAALACVLSVPAAAAVGTRASAAVLMDAGSGRVLFAQNPHEPRLIASTTKLMTALVALESGRALDETVVIDPAWAGAEGSSIYLRAGEKLRLETLLYGLLLRSGNDAALAVAGFCGGTVEGFVEQMNEKAEALGMRDSCFANPSGLDDPEHYSSAYDLALLARACLRNETLARIVSTKSIALEGRSFTNHNKLLWRYEGCVGLKTGYTREAGRTLVSAAERDGLTLICVTLHDSDDWADHAALFDYGFETCRAQVLLEAGETAARLPVTGSLVPFCPVAAAEPLAAALREGERAEVTLKLDQSALAAPVPAGVRVGEAVCVLDGEELARTPLVTARDICCDTAPKLGFWEQLKNLCS